MGKVRNALEIAIERAEQLGALSDEEKEKIKEKDTVKAILGDFFQVKIDSNGLWQRMKDVKRPLLRTAQMQLIDSLGLGNAQIELQRKKEGILAVETLKEKPNTALIESGLNAIESLVKEYDQMKRNLLDDLKKQIEANPQWRMQPVKTQDGKTVMKVTASVDEAAQARFAEVLSEHDEQFRNEFSELIEKLKETITQIQR
jgi:hypothetical protein